MDQRVVSIVMCLFLSLCLFVRGSPLPAQTSAPNPVSIKELAAQVEGVIQQLKSGNEETDLTLLRSILRKMETVAGPDHTALYPGFDAGAKYYEAKGNLAEALKFRERAQAILEKAKGPNSPEIGAGLNDLARLCAGTRDFALAARLYERVLSLVGLKPEIRVAGLSGLGDLSEQMGDHAAAKRTLEQLVTYTEQAFGKEHSYTGLALLKLASFLSERTAAEQARPYAERSVAILEKNHGSDNAILGDALRTLAAVKASLGEFREAESLYRRVLAMNEENGRKNTLMYAHVLDMLGAVLRLEGNLVGSEKLHLEALSINENGPAPNQVLLAESLRNLASLYQGVGDLPRAETYYRRALTIHEGMGNPQPYLTGMLLMGLATVTSERGDHARAFLLYEQTIAMFTKALGGKNPLVLNVYWILGVSAAQAGERERANRAFSTALDLTRTMPNLPDVSTLNIFNVLASTYLMQGDVDKARELYVRAFKIVERWPEAPTSIRVGPLMGLATIDLATGNLREAEQLSRQAEALLEHTFGSDHPDLVAPLLCLTFTELGQGRSESAIAVMSRALNIEEQNLNRIVATGFEAQKTAFMSTLAPTTDAAVSLHLETLPRNPHALKLALETVLRRKGRVLEEVAKRSRFVHDQLKPQDEGLIDQLNAARAEFAALVFRSRDATPPAALQEVVHGKEEELQRLEATVLEKSPAYAAFVKPITVEQVRDLLPSDAALVEIVRYHPASFSPHQRTSQKYAAYVLKRTQEPAGVALGQAAEIDSVVAKLRDALRDPKRTDAKAIARSLDDKIMRPLRGLLGTTKHILLSPDGALNLLPFEALVDESGKYLIESYSIAYLTSGRDILTARHASSREEPIIIANPTFDLGFVPKNPTHGPVSSDFQQLNYRPLAATAEEARGIKQVLGTATLFMGSDATEYVLKQVRGPQILHIATHGFFLNAPKESQTDTRLLTLASAEPHRAAVESKLLRSGLVLAGVKQGTSGAGEDGILTALEVSGLDLTGTKLVVLSACDTGVGDISNSEGVYGLRRALVMAGAESQVISLWPVSDAATRDLMVDFYTRLKGGEGRSDALRQARLTMLKDSRRAHPYYWAAFIQSGDWTEVKWTHEER